MRDGIAFSLPVKAHLVMKRGLGFDPIFGGVTNAETRD